MDNFVVGFIVILAVGYLLRLKLRSFRTQQSGGCGKCGCNKANPDSPTGK